MAATQLGCGHEPFDPLQLQMPKLGISGRIRRRPAVAWLDGPGLCWRLSRGNDPPAAAGASSIMIDPKAKLIAVLGNAQEYIDLAIGAEDRGEREFYERIAELYLKIAQELEAMMGG